MWLGERYTGSSNKEATLMNFTEWVNDKAQNLMGQYEEPTIKVRYAKFYREQGGSIVVHEEEFDMGASALDAIFNKAWGWPDMGHVAIKDGDLIRVSIHYPKGII